ncbi:uncharacterized protein ACWYII_046658 isoform 1-T1 [Salvelinus alpinus]
MPRKCKQSSSGHCVWFESKKNASKEDIRGTLVNKMKIKQRSKTKLLHKKTMGTKRHGNLGITQTEHDPQSGDDSTGRDESDCTQALSKSTSSNHHSDSSPLHKDPVVVLTRLAEVVVKTLLRDIKVCLVKEETDVRRDEDNHGGSPQFFPCPHCTISFTDCYFLENHIKTKHQKQYLAMLKSQVSKSKRVYGPTHSCAHCSCMFHTPRQLDIHTRQAHPSARPQKPATPRRTGRPHRVQEKFHTCPQCSRRFKYLGSLLKHCKSLHKMAVVLTNGHISCADCEKSFENCWGLGPHRCHEPEGNKPKDAKQMVIKEVGFQCLDCGKILTTPTSLNTHMRIHTGEKPYVCKECGKRFSDTSAYRYHLLIHNGVKPFKCQDCGKAFKQKSLLRKHMTVHSGERKYSCSQCDRQFAYRESLKLHLRTHSGERPFKCTVCGKDFADKGYLKTHLKIHNNQKNYHCGVCGQKFIRIGVLNIHLRSHTGERPYHCTVCDKQFARLDHLKNHQRTHTGEKPYTCTECGKSFTQSGDLTKHKRLHTGERPFECSECHKRFICSASLTLHMRTHTHRDVKPYSCQECGKSFYEQSHVNGHMKIHKGKRYSCPHCFISFARKSNLSKHLLRRHKPK